MDKQKKKWGPVALQLIGCALPVLLLLLLPFRGQLDISERENRCLTHFPALTLQNFFSGEFQNGLEKALGDQYPFSDEIKGTVQDVKAQVYAAEKNVLFSLAPQARLSYQEISKGYYHFAGDERYIVEKPDIRADYLPRMEENATWFNGIAGTEKYIYFIRNSRAHDFIRSEGENTAFDDLCRLYQADGAACFQAADFEEYRSLFYQTDHHWNAYGADRGYREILALLGMEKEALPVAKEWRFNVIFNGAYARQTGKMCADEGFSAYTYDLKKAMVQMDGQKGTYGHQALYEKDRYPTDELRNHYAYYHGGDYGEIIITRKQPDKMNLLLIADSYSNPLNLLLSAHFNNTHIIDLRYYEQNLGKPFDVNAYIAENQIDCLLMLGDIRLFGGEQGGID